MTFIEPSLDLSLESLKIVSFNIRCSWFGMSCQPFRFFSAQFRHQWRWNATKEAEGDEITTPLLISMWKPVVADLDVFSDVEKARVERIVIHNMEGLLPWKPVSGAA